VNDAFAMPNWQESSSSIVGFLQSEGPGAVKTALTCAHASACVEAQNAVRWIVGASFSWLEFR
jgi:hypothetical protein